MDMLTLALKSMGIDGDALINQAKQIGGAFQTIADKLEAISAKLERMDANQTAIMAAMGLYIPPPDGAMLALIETESAAHVAGIIALEPREDDPYSHEADMGAGRRRVAR
jgi:hypothetical protein